MSPEPSNPLLSAWTTPFGVPPFDQIHPDHFLPAFEAAMEEQRRDVDAIAASPDTATFGNTVEALEQSGVTLSNVRGVFSNLSTAETNAQLQEINLQIAPRLSALDDDIRLNPALFARIKRVWEDREGLNLSPAQRRLLDETYRDFARNGANLDEAGKAALRSVNAEIAELAVTFDQHLLHETNAYRLVIADGRDLAGLPQAVVAAASEAGGHGGTARPVAVHTARAEHLAVPGVRGHPRAAPRDPPGLHVASRPRRRVGQQGDRVAPGVAAPRASRLLGYATYADFKLEEAMAKTPARVYDLLEPLWAPARARALDEAAALQAEGAQNDPAFTLEPWDWRYYTEKIRKARYDLDMQALRPYFPLNRFATAPSTWPTGCTA